MKKIIATLLICVMTMSALSVGAAAAEQTVSRAGPADTGDMFGVVIVALLVSALGVAILVFHKTRFDCD